MVSPSHAASVFDALCYIPSAVSLAACGLAVVVASVQAQLQAVTNNKLVSQLHFNGDSCIDATRVVGVEWVPHTNGDLFVAAHSSGSVYTYSKVTSWNHLCMHTSILVVPAIFGRACTAAEQPAACVSGKRQWHWRWPFQCQNKWEPGACGDVDCLPEGPQCHSAFARWIQDRHSREGWSRPCP